MQTYLFILLGIETLALAFVIFVLIRRSKEISDFNTKCLRLRSEEEHLEKTQKERDSYIIMLVHDLRSPLSVIKGASDLILKEASNLSKDDIRNILGQIKNSSSGLLKLVNDILDISKIESGKFTVDKEISDLNEILKDEYESYKTLAVQKNISVNMGLDRNIPKLNLDPDRIRQVMNNLLSNSIKFTEAGGRINIYSRLVGGKVEVEVNDTGVGVPDKLKPRLFHKFTQLGGGYDEDMDEKKGTGLGLVIAKEIVESHGGEIWMEDNKPRGSKFIFTLPVE